MAHDVRIHLQVGIVVQQLNSTSLGIERAVMFVRKHFGPAANNPYNCIADCDSGNYSYSVGTPSRRIQESPQQVRAENEKKRITDACDFRVNALRAAEQGTAAHHHWRAQDHQKYCITA